MPGRVLVVDDMLPNIKVLEAKLTGEYFDVITAENGLEALEKAKTESPDIVLLDVMMPDMDGFEVCQTLKADPSTMHIPVVMVTALSEREDRVRGLEAGADEFLTKPVRDLPLFSRVRSLIRLKTLMDAWRIRQETSSEFGLVEAAEDLDKKAASIALLSDDEILTKQIKRFLDHDDHNISVFETTDAFVHGVNNNHYDLAISLLHIGSADILRPCSNLRSQEKTRHLPILLVAEEDDEPLLVKGLELGVNDYIMRPLDDNELRARVATQVQRMRFQERLRSNYEKSINLALTDELTSLYNRRYFNSHLDGLLSEAEERYKSVSVVMIDIDHFKSVNDTYGHDEGDKILIDVAKRLMKSVRDSDLVARLGGEEFAVVMPDTRIGIGLLIAERLRQAIEREPFDLLSGKKLDVSISVGLACTGAERGIDRAKLMKTADEALYKAKNNGRNRVVVGHLTEPKQQAF